MAFPECSFGGTFLAGLTVNLDYTARFHKDSSNMKNLPACVSNHRKMTKNANLTVNLFTAYLQTITLTQAQNSQVLVFPTLRDTNLV